MRVVLKPLPVLYACQGCPRYGQRARDAGAELERRGLAELRWLGARAVADGPASERYPLIALDGCAEGCARRWLCERGAAPQEHVIVQIAG